MVSLIHSVSPERALLGNSAISSHLLEHLRSLNYPEKSIQSMLKCGTPSGFEGLMHCTSCNKMHSIPFAHHCNLRTCSSCAKIRRKRIFRDYSPIISQYSTDSHAKEFLYFLTISPEHYSTLAEGLKHVRKSLSKFLRAKYIKDRVKGGLYVIETKNTGKGFHVHIHAIVFGRWLDNRIRGNCPKCSQHLMKKDHTTDKFYCANKNCNNTENLVINQDSKLVSIWKHCSSREVNINIQRQSSPNHTLNYMLKYISVNKDDFQNFQQMAEYIFETRKQKLIVKFGSFFRVKFPKVFPVCRDCGGDVEFIIDQEVIFAIRQSLSRPPPDLPVLLFSEN